MRREGEVRSRGRRIAAYGRIGYAAKAAVYIVVGALALGMSIGVARNAPNTEGALAAILQQQYGAALLGLLCFGLFGYALWQLVAALVDGEHDGSDTKGRLARLGKGWGAFVYTVLALDAGQVLLWRLAGREHTEAWIAILLRIPLGSVFVLLVGAGIVAYGLYQFYAAYKPPVRWRSDVACLGPRACAVALWVGRFGLVARGVLFSLVGSWLVLAAVRADPRAAAGLGETFGMLGQGPLGPWVLATLAAGFIAYGLFELFNAWFRELRTG